MTFLLCAAAASFFLSYVNLARGNNDHTSNILGASLSLAMGVVLLWAAVTGWR